MIDSFLAHIKQKLLSITGYDHPNWVEIGAYALLPFVCLLIELLIKGYEKSSLKNLLEYPKLSWVDYCWVLIQSLNLYRLMGVVFTFGIFYFCYGKIQKTFHFNLIQKIESPWLQFLIVFIISDFKNYIKHYVQHIWQWVWELHKIHHSAEKMNMFNLYRSTAVETAWTSFVELIPFIVLGAPATTYLWVMLLKEAHQFFLHSEINSDWGFLGKYILVSSAAHRIHHSTNPAHYGKNFGNTFIFWDRLLNTYYAPQKEEAISFGLADNPYNKGFWHDFFLSYKNALLAIKNDLQALAKK